MSARILSGEAIANAIKAETTAIAGELIKKRGRAPCLTVVASADESAKIYAEKIKRDAAVCHINVEVAPLDINISHADAMQQIRAIVNNPAVDAVLLQTPLPKNVNAVAAADLIPIEKDVDGASISSAGAAALGRAEGYFPATAAAVLEILQRSNINISGARAVVLGRSAVVGRPAAFGLLTLHATVTIAHSKTTHIEKIVREADILVVAIGKVAFVVPDWIRPNTTVMDVGIHRVTDAHLVKTWFANDPARVAAFDKKGSAIVGDCDPRIVEIAGAMTPVPGGVGPVTSAILLKQAAIAANRLS
ncbi:MAG: bifunctional 5,10-methylenetetrahydrofolate dehydrogenase/5,10-methenyltetrahydrofolate cyclohydrolase [Planctomycetota bacterium]